MSASMPAPRSTAPSASCEPERGLLTDTPSPATGSTDGERPGLRAPQRSSVAVCSATCGLVPREAEAVREERSAAAPVARLAGAPAVVAAASGVPAEMLGTGATEPLKTARPLDVARSLLRAPAPVVDRSVLLLLCTSGSSTTSGSRKPDEGVELDGARVGRLACGVAAAGAGAADC